VGVNVVDGGGFANPMLLPATGVDMAIRRVILDCSSSAQGLGMPTHSKMRTDRVQAAARPRWRRAPRLR
jgi:hypothetical protein